MKRVGVVGVAGGWSSEKLADAMAELTGQRILIEMDKVVLDAASGSVSAGELNLCEMDGLVVKKIARQYSPDLLNRLEILRHLHESCGVPVFSPPAGMMRAVDRLSNTLTLQHSNIPLPPTVITGDIEAAIQAVQKFEQAVLKPLYTSKARGMRVVGRDDDIRSEIESFRAAGNSIFYVQKLIDIAGRDLGVAFLGGDYLATYARVGASGSWNTTIKSGGTYQPEEPPQEIIDLAHRAQQPFGLDFTCVDIGVTPDGPLVFEVSAFGGFHGLYNAHGIDAAKLYAQYVFARLNGG
jgi:ATP-grasp enzyme of GAK system